MTLWKRLMALAMGGLASSLITACKPASIQGIECYPEPARRWISHTQPDAISTPEPSVPVTLYVDGSGSMAGYLNGATQRERPFHDLVDSLPVTAGSTRERVSYKLFGKGLHGVAAARSESLLWPTTYDCRGCDNQESHLDMVLRDVSAAPPQSLSLIVTDLWLNNSEVLTSGAVSFTEPLTAILAGGRSVAIYGLPAPYKGTVFDLPSGRRDIAASRRPLFLMAIGPIDQLRALHRRMLRSPSALVASGLASGAIKYSLFTLTPETPAAAEAQPFTADRPGAVSRAVFLRPREGVRLQQFSVSRAAALRLAAAGAESPPGRPLAWAGPKSEAIAPGAVWSGPMAGRAHVWSLKTDRNACQADRDWNDWGDYGVGWRGADDAGRQVFALDPVEAAGQLRPGSYLIVGEVRRLSLASPNPANGWMREWSFAAPEETAAIARSAQMFPTLNLSETARLLESALAEAAERSPTVLAGFAVALKVED